MNATMDEETVKRIWDDNGDVAPGTRAEKLKLDLEAREAWRSKLGPALTEQLNRFPQRERETSAFAQVKNDMLRLRRAFEVRDGEVALYLIEKIQAAVKLDFPEIELPKVAQPGPYSGT